MIGQQNTSSRIATSASRDAPAHPAARSSARSARTSTRLGWGSVQALEARQGASASASASRHRRPRSADPTRRSKSRHKQRSDTAAAGSASASLGNARRPPVAAREAARNSAGQELVWRSVEAALGWLETHTHIPNWVREWIEALAGKLEARAKAVVGGATPHGPGVTAGLAALRAVLAGKSPVVPAVKGLVSALSTKTKVASVLLLALGLLLGPVLLVVLVLALVVAGLVAAVRAAGNG